MVSFIKKKKKLLCVQFLFLLLINGVDIAYLIFIGESDEKRMSIIQLKMYLYLLVNVNQVDCTAYQHRIKIEGSKLSGAQWYYL